jgi:hypothetical protein
MYPAGYLAEIPNKSIDTYQGMKIIDHPPKIDCIK